MPNIVNITAEDGYFVTKWRYTVGITAHEIESKIHWTVISNTPPGLKYDSECINAILKTIGIFDEESKVRNIIHISPEAQVLLDKATDAARQLY